MNNSNYSKKHRLRRVICLILSVIILLSTTSAVINPSDKANRIGDSSVRWEFDESSGRLTISGSGHCDAFLSREDQPWASVRNRITAVVFNDMAALDIGSLAYWFDGCTNLVSAEIPYTTSEIGSYAFGSCNSLSKLYVYYYDSDVFHFCHDWYFRDNSDHTEDFTVLLDMTQMSVVRAFAGQNYPGALCFQNIYAINSLYAHAKEDCTGGFEYSCDAGHPHAERYRCYTCGAHYVTGTYATKAHGPGTYGSGTCPSCGTCSFGATTWNGCAWSQSCSCGKKRSGVSHNYGYGDWYYGNESYHYADGVCSYCYATTTKSGTHTQVQKYENINIDYHIPYKYCESCKSVIGDKDPQVRCSDADVNGYCDYCNAPYRIPITWDAGTNKGTINGTGSITELQACHSNVSVIGYVPVKAGSTFTGWYTSPADGLVETTDFIANLLSAGAGSSQSSYILVGEPFTYDCVFSDFNGHTHWFAEDGNTDSLLSRKWMYQHDSGYYCNSLGVLQNNGAWMLDPISSFTLPGLYYVDFKMKDNSVPDAYLSDNSVYNPFHDYRYWSNNYGNDEYLEDGTVANPYARIYVHRRPLADFTFVANLNNTGELSSIIVTDEAYDIDHYESGNAQSMGNKGLQMFEWAYQLSNNPSIGETALFLDAATGQAWINSKLAAISYDSTTAVILSYRVRDIDGDVGVETYSYTYKSGTSWLKKTQTAYVPNGTWSEYKSVYVSGESVAPIAKFSTDKYRYEIGEPITITDESFSPNGNTITKWKWTITGGSANISNTITYQLGSSISSVEDMNRKVSEWAFSIIDNQLLSSSDAGNRYTISLEVTDNKSVPFVSEHPYSITIQIYAGNKAPVASGATSGSLYENNKLLVYEYDSYDASLLNNYYSVNGTRYYRGSEVLNWGLSIIDPDNVDKYGTANNSSYFSLLYRLERFTFPSISQVPDLVGANEAWSFGPYQITAAAANPITISPFSTVKDAGLKWGAYRITTSITDIPDNGKAGLTTSIISSATSAPYHLYVIPALVLQDIHYSWDGMADTQEQIPVGDPFTVTVKTNAQVTNLMVSMPDGEGSSAVFYATSTPTADGMLLWSTEVVVPDTVEEDDLIDARRYSFQVIAETDYGDPGTVTRTKTATQTINVLAIKLYNFHVTNIIDPAVGFNGTSVYVKDLAYDETDSPLSTLSAKGYTFYFQLTSVGLKDNTDGVRIIPSFFAEGTSGQFHELDMYYKNSSGDYVLATYSPSATTNANDTFILYAETESSDSLGSLRAITLDSDNRALYGKEQLWYGRYGIPSTALFVRKGESLTENNLIKDKILVTFDISAMKRGVEKYSYVGRGQWAKERFSSAGVLINPAKSKYPDGAVIVIDGEKTALDNYEALPVWHKS